MSFTHADVAFATGYRAPETGWQRRTLPVLELKEEAREKTGQTLVWVRFRFDKLAQGPLALELDHISERFIITLNGVAISRNYSDENSAIFGWNRPWLVPLPPQLLRDTGNDLVLRIDSNVDWKLGLGGMRIGPDRQIRENYDQRYFWRATLPSVINLMLFILTIMVIIIWIQRPREMVIFWFGLAGLLWWFRNLLFYVQSPPVSGPLFWDLSVYALFALMTPFFAFVVTFLNLPQRKRLILWFMAGSLSLIVLRVLLLNQNLSDIFCYILIAGMVLSTIFVLARACWRNPNLTHVAMLSAVASMFAALLHDFGFANGAWQGLTIYLEPYCSFGVFTVWGASQWFRMLEAMREVDVLNLTLEEKVADATHKLAKSEAVRRKLEVASAVEKERERMMFEIHDGIGSNLVTALTVAQKQNESPGTIQTLKRSLTDLRLAVDSLDSVDGDLPLLLASVRYRMEPDLKLAGIGLDWQVEECPPLEWLDATGALHVLRILQEAVSNIMSHSGASRINVGCRVETQLGGDGILVTLADNGNGMGGATEICGKGLANMRARADALGGSFVIDENYPKGTRLKLWLPIQAPNGGGDAEAVFEAGNRGMINVH